VLTILRRIVQEVSDAQDLGEALNILVQGIAKAIDTEAASLFLIDNARAEYVLMATTGLNPKAVGKLRFGLHQGLVGLVGRREEPINLPNAPLHPDFLHLPQAQEESFNAFLGVPVIHHRRLYGVLVVQQKQTRSFDESEEAFLVTLAVQVGGIIAEAQASGAISRLPIFSGGHAISERKNLTITGIPAVPGVGIGEGVVVYPLADLDAVPDLFHQDKDKQWQLWLEAIVSVKREIQALMSKHQMNLSPQDVAIFEAYLKIIESDSLSQDIQAHLAKGAGIQTALKKVIKKHMNYFSNLDDPYLQDKASDFRDIGRRILSHLQAKQPKRVDYPEKTILLGEEVTAGQLLEVPEGKLKGLVSAEGSSNSHVAILARALNIPVVMGAKGLSLSEAQSKCVIVNGYVGKVFIEPNLRLLKEYELLEQEEQELNERLQILHGESAITLDGHILDLHVNTGLEGDTSLALSVGAEGIGLYRTEIPFLKNDRFPSEEEQFVIYRQFLKAFSPRPVVMRTLDVGGDKILPYFSYEEKNPFLGWRGIRVTLDHPEIFLMQVRAMLRANVEFGNLRILLPMLSNVGELDEALHLIAQANREIKEEYQDNNYLPSVGAMIEVPSAIYQARAFAKRVDFLSIGSNDLTQYLLAVDRNNTKVSGLYDAFHPAVLQALKEVVEAGHSEGKSVSICGEIAGDPLASMLLLAMGFDSLSMNASSLLRVKWVIRHVDLASARKLLHEILEIESAALIRLRLEQALAERGLGSLVRAGKR